MEAFSVDSADRNGKDRIGVSVKITLILGTASVACRKNEDRTLSTTSLVYSVDHSLQDNSIGRFH